MQVKNRRSNTTLCDNTTLVAELQPFVSPALPDTPDTPPPDSGRACDGFRAGLQSRRHFWPLHT
jgi:hypothetical protein